MKEERYKILVIEDNPNHLELMLQYLPDTLFDIDTAMSYKEALEKVRKNDFEIITIDYYLPDGNGMDLMKEIHSSKPKQKMILVTAETDPELSFEALRSGALDYVVKSYQYFKQLKDRIMENLEEDDEY
ncbi:MAG: response regulator [Candidatus Methanomethylophilaceae archaeon]|nr:response regulator [Candidatus Methanomethylophilaceae archaeon]